MGNIVELDKIKNVKLRKQYMIFGLILFIISLFSYSIMMINSATNGIDSIWHGVMANSGEWEITTGRWFWYLSDRLQFVVCPDPITTAFALLKFIISIILLIDVFNIDKKLDILIGITAMISLVNIAVCSELGFRYQSNAFGFAVLFLSLAFWLSTKYSGIKYDAVIIVLITCSLGCYQNDIGIICMLVCVYSIFMIIQNADIKDVFKYIRRMLIDGVISCILYFGMLYLFLWMFDYRLENYRGFTSFTLKDFFINLPKNVLRTYTILINYFNQKMIDGVVNKLTTMGIFGVILYVLVWSVIVSFLFQKLLKIRQRKLDTIIYLLLILLIPIATNIILLVADTQLSTHMTLNIMYMFFVLLVMSISVFRERLYRIIACIVLGILCYGQFYMVQYDQMTMVEGKEFVSELVSGIADRLYEVEDIDKKQVVVIGCPANSPIFSKQIFDKGNVYAKYGFFYMRECWEGWFENLKHIKVPIAKEEIWNNTKEIMDGKEIKSVYPDKDCIVVSDDIVIVYISSVDNISYWN